MGRVYTALGENLSFGESSCLGVTDAPFPSFGVEMGAVQILLSGRRPSAITWIVMAIVINSVKCLAFGALAHIGKKVLKYRPSITDGDTATTIKVEVIRARISATLKHRIPGIISACLDFLFAGVPMSPASLTTSAGFCFSVPQVFSSNSLSFAAFALAIPCDPTVRAVVCSLYDGKSSVLLSGYINKRHVNIIPRICDVLAVRQLVRGVF